MIAKSILLTISSLILMVSYSNANTVHNITYSQYKKGNKSGDFRPKTQFVRPYVKRNGKIVTPHFRRKPVR